MPAPRYLPSDEKLAEMAKTMTHAEIAEWVYRTSGYKVGRSTVSAALSRAGLTERVRYDKALPWPRIKAIHNGHYAAQMLRAGARIDAGAPVSDELAQRYHNWVARLKDEDAVVHYDPDTEDGFFYLKRRPKIDKGLIRNPKVP